MFGVNLGRPSFSKPGRLGLEKKGANITHPRDQETNRYNENDGLSMLELSFGTDIWFGNAEILYI